MPQPQLTAEITSRFYDAMQPRSPSAGGRRPQLYRGTLSPDFHDIIAVIRRELPPKEELTEARTIHDPIVAFRRRVLDGFNRRVRALDSIDTSAAEERRGSVAGTSGPGAAVEKLLPRDIRPI